MKLPLGKQLLALKQRIYLSHLRRKNHRQKIKKLNSMSYYNSRVNHNLEKLKQYSLISLNNVVALEIGSGKHLIAPIGLSLLGLKKVIATDICRAVPERVKVVLNFYYKNAKKFGLEKVPYVAEKITDENIDNVLLNYFNIDYRAPYDAAHTDLPDNSVDYIFANVVFEHVHKNVLSDMIKESFRILRGGGVYYILVLISKTIARGLCILMD